MFAVVAIDAVAEGWARKEVDAVTVLDCREPGVGSAPGVRGWSWMTAVVDMLEIKFGIISLCCCPGE